MNNTKSTQDIKEMTDTKLETEKTTVLTPKPTTDNTKMTQANTMTTPIITDNALEQSVSSNEVLEQPIIEVKEQEGAIADENLLKLQDLEDERQAQEKNSLEVKKKQLAELERSQLALATLLGIDTPLIKKLPIGQCKVEQLIDRVSVSFTKSDSGMYTEHFSLSGRVPLFKKGQNRKVIIRDKEASLALLKSFPEKELYSVLLAAQAAYVDKEALYETENWKNKAEAAKLKRLESKERKMKLEKYVANGNR